jgi:hypothetical protein
MDTKNWISALELYFQYPVLLIATFLVACAVFTFAWWLRGHWATGSIEALKEHLATLKERLEFADQRLADVKEQLAEAQAKLNAQERQITEVRQTPWFAQLPPDTRLTVERLARSNTEVQTVLSSVSGSTDLLKELLESSRKELAQTTVTLFTAGGDIIIRR